MVQSVRPHSSPCRSRRSRRDERVFVPRVAGLRCCSVQPAGDLRTLAIFLSISGGVTVLIGVAAPRLALPHWTRTVAVAESVLAKSNGGEVAGSVALVNVGIDRVFDVPEHP